MMKQHFTSNLIKSLALGSAFSFALSTMSCSFREQDIVNKMPLSNKNGKTDSSHQQDAVLPKRYMGEEPNIVYIVIDDSGYSSIGSYGSEINTPNIDRLADNGLRYNNFTVTPVCSPTRASLLTGRNHHSVGMGTVSSYDLGPEVPNYRGRITDKAATTAEVLKDNGYSTYAVGKWHLSPGYENGITGPFDSWPLGRGFERFYGFLAGSTNQFLPLLVEDNKYLDESPGDISDDYHVSEDFVDQSIQLIRNQESVTPEKPFFLYLGFGAVHSPHQPPKENMDKYKSVYDIGWDVIRDQRLAKQKELGIVPSDTVLSPLNKDVTPWNELSDDQKRLYARFQEAYAGFIDHTDEQIGRLLDYLESIDELDNTIIVFMFDNGGSNGGAEDGRVNYVAHQNGINRTTEEVLARIDEIGEVQTNVNYPTGWAQADNTPFPYYKGNVHFGGVKVPLIISWPDGIKDKGEIRTQYHHIIDITPTMYDILGIRSPEVYKGVEQMPMHGVSMAYSFDNTDEPTHRNTQYFSMIGDRGIIHDEWAAAVIHKPGIPFEEDQWTLFNLNDDFSQAHDLAAEYPEKLTELKQLWMVEAKKYNVLPLIDPSGDLMAYRPSTNEVTNRSSFKYYPGISHLPNSIAPPISGKKHSITIPIDRAGLTDEGILVAHGDSTGGYVLYIRDNKLVYEYNFVGEMFRIESETDVPIGRSTIHLVLTPEDRIRATVELYIDNIMTAKGDIMTIPIKQSHEGLTIGSDKYGKVSESYQDMGDYPFTGRIEKVEYKVEIHFKDIIPEIKKQREKQMTMSEL